MRVAIFATNDPENVSGGRYHALMLAYAVASLGWEAHFVTDNKPSFFEDLGVLASGVKLHLSPDFASRLPGPPFDWTIIVPTGVFLPEFYEAGLAFARASRARVGLVNFETAEWFNALAPAPRDPRLWDDWRRACLEGALVLSSTRESNDWARRFYTAPEGRIRFEVWQPPINSVAARRFDELEKDGSVVAFVRPQDNHKGAGVLAELDPRLFRHRTLHLVSGRQAPAAFKSEIAKRLEQEEGARVVFHLRINDQHKFRLLAAAQAVLFPSRFEGYGYPPVEAAYSGTESVVFDLPVLRETVGAVAHFAPTPDVAGFESATATALAHSERRAELRKAVFEIGDFHRCALRLADILLRSADSVAPLKPRLHRALLGPFPPTPASPPDAIDRQAPTPPFPPHIVSAVETTSGDLLSTLRVWLPETTKAVDVALSSGALLPAAWRFAGEAIDGFREGRVHILAPKEALGRKIVATARATDRSLPSLELRIDRPTPADAARPALAGVSEDDVGPQGRRRLRAWTLARQPLNEVLLSSDGRSWRSFSIDRERRDIAEKYPAYGTARCEFRAQTPAGFELEGGRTLLLCVDASLQAVDALVGWPPKPSTYFIGAAKPTETLPPPLIGFGPRPRRPQLGELALAPINDAHWRNGVALFGAADRLGALLVAKDSPSALLKRGAVLRFASGASRRILAVEPHAAFLHVTLEGTLSPHATGGSAAATVHSGDWTPFAEREFTLFAWTDSRWWRGVWNTRDRRFRCGFTIKTAQAGELGLRAGAKLRFAATGLRVIREIDESRGNMRVWLDGPIRPLGDASQSIVILGDECGPRAGLAFARDVDDPRTIIVEGEGARQIRAGDLLRLGWETMARVLSARAEPDCVRVRLDRVSDPPQADPILHFVDEADAPDGYTTPYRRPGFDLKAKDPLFRILAREAIMRGSALRSIQPSPSAQRRALVVSLVSPCPANQGNRVVTRNLIRRLVALGFQCDVVVQNAVDAAAVADEFGANARFFAVAYPDWRASEAYGLRRSIADTARPLRANPLDIDTADAIDLAASQYHPYFIVRDETVEIARTLYAQHAYETVVVNYTHMTRVAEELQAIRPLPPTAIFTHDALSRLPRAFAGRKLDLAHRPCGAEAERDVLNAALGACVVAISKTEADYFRAIGVTNRIAVCEYDAEEEMAPFAIPSNAFERRTLIFHGSANPMNVAGLDWFVDECWAQILAEAPDARLLVCGGVGAAWSPQIPGVEIVGELSREGMLELCAGASLAINPCVAGSGLKIKTVETAALGLPAVCLPTAVEGLEDVADRFAIVAADAMRFIAGCVTLLTDRRRWSELRAGARALSVQRFSAAVVYRELDEAMGWREPAPAPTEFEAPGEDGLAHVANPVAALEREPEDEAAQFALGKSLARGGRADIGWAMVDRIAASRRGDWRAAREAAELGVLSGAPWRAAIFAARLIAQRPAQSPGYLLMGRALTLCNLPHEAAAAFEQCLMVAPFDEEAKRGLVDALARAGRRDEADMWLRRPAASLRLGQYFALRPLMPGVVARGFENEAGDALLLRAGEGSLLLPAPHEDAPLLTAALDIERSKDMARDVQLEVAFEGRRRLCLLRARGPGVQTISIDVDAGAFSSGYARLGLRALAPPTFEAPLRLIGLVIASQEAAERVAASV
jgi:glycosyltransferase involved in cell wall biosynthesis